MQIKRMTILASIATVCFLGLTSVVRANAQTGMIISRSGDTFVMNGDSGKTTVVLTDTTDTRDNRGLFGLDKDHMGDTVLIPGLKVKVEGTADSQGRVVATKITVDGDDLETAEMIESGLHPTAEQVAANVHQIEKNRKDIAALQAGQNQPPTPQYIKEVEDQSGRFAALGDYDVKAEATVKFGVGSSKLDAADQEELKKLAATATGLKGYLVEVTGYADATGGAEMNTKLSENRAKAVTIFLMQQGSVPVRHIVAPGAMGEYGAAAPNETKEGRAENRRVEVKVLVNKGISGS